MYLVTLGLALVAPPSPKCASVLLVEAGTHLIFDAMIVPIPYWRTGQSSETVALCGGGHATDVGPRVALICHGAGDIGNLDVSIWDGFRLMSNSWCKKL